MFVDRHITNHTSNTKHDYYCNSCRSNWRREIFFLIIKIFSRFISSRYLFVIIIIISKYIQWPSESFGGRYDVDTWECMYKLLRLEWPSCIALRPSLDYDPNFVQGLFSLPMEIHSSLYSFYSFLPLPLPLSLPSFFDLNLTTCFLDYNTPDCEFFFPLR